MNKIATQDETHATPEKFYMPAVTMPPNLGRIEDVVTDLFEFHGVVLIPDSYNK